MVIMLLSAAVADAATAVAAVATSQKATATSTSQTVDDMAACDEDRYRRGRMLELVCISQTDPCPRLPGSASANAPFSTCRGRLTLVCRPGEYARSNEE